MASRRLLHPPPTMMILLTLAALPVISALIPEGMAQPAENVQPQVTQCEQYNRTQCPVDNPLSSLCKEKTISCNEWDDPGKINQCYVVWSNLSGTAEVIFKGCLWDYKDCKDECISSQPVNSLTKKKHHLFCCCVHNNCNQNFSWQPKAEVPSTTPVPQCISTYDCDQARYRMEGETPKKRRKVNWSKDAILLLLQLVLRNKRTIENKRFHNNCSAQDRKETWQYITAEINAAFPEERREKEEVEKKWYSLRSAGKEELHKWKTKITGTGGGPVTSDLSDTSVMVGEIFGIDNAYVSGIADGLVSNQVEPTQESNPPPLQSDDTPVVITVGPTAEDELAMAVITAQAVLVAQQVEDVQPPAANLQPPTADLQQPALASPHASAGLASLKAAAAKQLQAIAATKKILTEQELEYTKILAAIAAQRN